MSVTLYVKEARVLAYDLRDSATREFLTLSAGYLEVMKRSDGSVFIAEFSVGVTGGRIYWLVNTTNLTAAVGAYDLWWRAVSGSETFIFKTTFDVVARV